MKRLILAAILALTSIGLVATPVAADDFECGTPGGDPETIEGGTFDNIVVPTGATCVLIGVTVQGNVLAKPASELEIDESTVGGGLKAETDAGVFGFGTTVAGSWICDGCFFDDLFSVNVGGDISVKGAELGNFMCDVTVGGNLTITESIGGDGFPFEIDNAGVDGNLAFTRNEGPASITNSGIGGSLQFSNNDVNGVADAVACDGPSGSITDGTLVGNEVGGNIQVTRNTGQLTIADNHADGSLQCSGNTPPPVGGGNTASSKQGQCRTL